MKLSRVSPLYLDSFLMVGVLVVTFCFDAHVVISIGIPFLVAGSALAIPLILRTGQIGKSAFPGILYIACICISLFWSRSLEACGARVAVNFLGLALFMRISQSGFEDHYGEWNAGLRWAKVLAVSGCIMGIHYLSTVWSLRSQGLLAEGFQERYVGGKLSITWGASNTIAAALLVTVFPAALGFRLSFRGRWLWLLVMSVIVLAIVLTLSRTVIVVLVFSGILYLGVSRKLKFVWIGLSLAAMLAILLVALLEEDVLATILDTRLSDTEEVTSLNGRFEIWLSTSEYLFSTFPLPIGYFSSIYVFTYSPHNILISNLLEIGFWGAAALTYFLGGIIRRGVNARKSTVVGSGEWESMNILLVGIAAILVNLLFEDAQYTQPYIIYWWAYLGLLESRSYCLMRSRPAMHMDVTSTSIPTKTSLTTS